MNNKETNKEPVSSRDSFVELLGQLAKNSAAVVHDEIDLLTQGVREMVQAKLRSALTLAVGAVILFSAFLSLCAALIIGLSYYMTYFVAALATGTTLTLIGVVVVFIGYEQLKKAN